MKKSADGRGDSGAAERAGSLRARFDQGLFGFFAFLGAIFAGSVLRTSLFAGPTVVDTAAGTILSFLRPGAAEILDWLTWAIWLGTLVWSLQRLFGFRSARAWVAWGVVIWGVVWPLDQCRYYGPSMLPGMRDHLERILASGTEDFYGWVLPTRRRELYLCQIEGTSWAHRRFRVLGRKRRAADRRLQQGGPIPVLDWRLVPAGTRLPRSLTYVIGAEVVPLLRLTNGTYVHLVGPIRPDPSANHRAGYWAPRSVDWFVEQAWDPHARRPLTPQELDRLGRVIRTDAGGNVLRASAAP